MQTRRKRVYLAIQNAWDSELLTMPLALGYLKAYAESHAEIREAYDIRIFNFYRRASVSEMAMELLRDPPDVLAFSVLGWNANNFGRLSDTYRQVRPDGWCVFGGNHASHQAARVFRLFPSVDVVVNGEGEITFSELLMAHLTGSRPSDCGHIRGLSFRLPDGSIRSTPERERIRNLDDIPSPFLSGAIPLFDADGRFPYDVALMETNRGCPYSCSFCYWGGAVGQKIFSFSRERLREELEFFARSGIENIALCDSNFGMLRSDADFVEDLIEMRGRYTYPRSLLTSWAKNKNKVFFSIVERLKEAGFHSSFTLSLQTLSPEALEHMQRKNMKLNEFEDMCAWLEHKQMDMDVELIWGAPGETCSSFFTGYDRIAKHAPRIATYPMLILPNTEYARRRNDHGMITVRDTASDFEFVLAHSTLSLEENRQMHHFLFWARLLAEHQVLRLPFIAINKLLDCSQSAALLSADEFFGAHESQAAAGLRKHLRDVVENLDITRITNAVVYTYVHEAALEPLFFDWWRQYVRAHAAPQQWPFLEDLFRYDWMSRPYHDDAAALARPATDELDGQTYWRRTRRFSYDVPVQLSALQCGRPIDFEARCEHELTLYFRPGFAQVAANHEIVSRFSGKERAALSAANHRERSAVPVNVLGIDPGGRADASIAGAAAAR